MTLEVLVEKKLDVDKMIKALGTDGGKLIRKVVRRFIIQVGKFEWGPEDEQNLNGEPDNNTNGGDRDREVAPAAAALPAPPAIEEVKEDEAPVPAVAETAPTENTEEE